MPANRVRIRPARTFIKEFYHQIMLTPAFAAAMNVSSCGNLSGRFGQAVIRLAKPGLGQRGTGLIINGLRQTLGVRIGDWFKNVIGLALPESPPGTALFRGFQDNHGGIRRSRRWGSRSLAGKPLAGFRATPSRRIPVLYGMVVYAIRFNNQLLHRQPTLRKRRLGENRGFRPSF